MKKLLLFMVLFCTMAFADIYLVKAKLDASRLEPYARTGILVIAELEHDAILLVNENDLSKIPDSVYAILEKNPVQGDHYLIRKMDDLLDLTYYGDILFRKE